MNIRVRVCKACLQSSLKSLSQISRSRILLVGILSSFPDVQMSIPSGTSVMTAVIQSTRFPSTLVYPLLSWFSYWPWELCLGTSTTTRNDRTGRLMLSSPPMKSSRRFKFTRFFFLGHEVQREDTCCVLTHRMCMLHNTRWLPRFHWAPPDKGGRVGVVLKIYCFLSLFIVEVCS